LNIKESIHAALQEVMGGNLLCDWVLSATYVDESGDKCWGVYQREDMMTPTALGLSNLAVKIFDEVIEQMLYSGAEE